MTDTFDLNGVIVRVSALEKVDAGEEGGANRQNFVVLKVEGEAFTCDLVIPAAIAVKLADKIKEKAAL